MGDLVVDKTKNDSGLLVEFLMCGMEFPQQAKLLQDPNEWIADTGVAVRSSPYQQGMENFFESHKQLMLSPWEMAKMRKQL